MALATACTMLPLPAKIMIRDSERLQRILIQSIFIFITVLISVMAIAWVLQKILVKEALELEADWFIQAYEKDNDFPLPRTRNLIGYLANKEDKGNLPKSLHSLQPGLHLDIKPEPNDRPLPVYVEDFSQGRLYLVFAGYNVNRLVGWFGILPVIMLLIVVYATSWIAYQLSIKAVSPVMKIAKRLRNISPDDEKIPLPTKGLRGETRELVIALDEYKQRLEVMLERERHFTSDVSHELRTPITIIDGAAQFLETETNISVKGRKRAKMIRRACRDISEIIDAFLILGREPEQLTKEDCVDVSEIAQNELAKLAPLISGKNLSFELISTSKLCLPAHRKIIAIVINNLCRNAINYSEKGTIKVTINEHGLTVEDSGAGIDEQLIPHIFGRHIRGRGVQKAGEGLGLNIVKRLCDMNNWQIEVYNLSEGGVCVSIRMLV